MTSASLACDHCGDIAIEVARVHFLDGEGTKCTSCGMPGHVVVCGDDEDPDLNPVYWSDTQEAGVYCTRADCEECTEMRIEEGNAKAPSPAPEAKR